MIDVCLHYGSDKILKCDPHFLKIIADTCRSFDVGRVWLVGFPESICLSGVKYCHIVGVDQLPDFRQKVFFESAHALSESYEKIERRGSWHILGLSQFSRNAIVVFGGDGREPGFIESNLNREWCAIETPIDNSLWSCVALGIVLYELCSISDFRYRPKLR